MYDRRITLVDIHDADFLWMLGGEPSRFDPRQPPGGVNGHETVVVVRTIHDALGGDGHPGSRMLVADGEVVGLCGYVRPAEHPGSVEIGFGVAPVTAGDNLPSQAVLALNGFVETGREVRDEDGPVILWRLHLI